MPTTPECDQCCACHLSCLEQGGSRWGQESETQTVSNTVLLHTMLELQMMEELKLGKTMVLQLKLMLTTIPKMVLILGQQDTFAQRQQDQLQQHRG